MPEQVARGADVQAIIARLGQADQTGVLQQSRWARYECAVLDGADLAAREDPQPPRRRRRQPSRAERLAADLDAVEFCRAIAQETIAQADPDVAFAVFEKRLDRRLAAMSRRFFRSWHLRCDRFFRGSYAGVTRPIRRDDEMLAVRVAPCAPLAVEEGKGTPVTTIREDLCHVGLGDAVLRICQREASMLVDSPGFATWADEQTAGKMHRSSRGERACARIERKQAVLGHRPDAAVAARQQGVDRRDAQRLSVRAGHAGPVIAGEPEHSL